MAVVNNTPEGYGRECVLLLSGGLDSTTLLAAARDRAWKVNALTLRYGQKHHFELEAAKKIASKHQCNRHILLDLPLSEVAVSALTSRAIEVPRGGQGEGIPATYVPARNLVFLSIAVSWAESLNLSDIFIAISSVDFSGYPDCREEFIMAFEKAAEAGTKMGAEKKMISIHAPFILMSKKEIVALGLSLGVDYSMTHTCYSPSEDGRACGTCDACLLRLKGFKEAEAADPAPYLKRDET